MIHWDEQPVDVAGMFNPAFVGEIIRQIVEGYGNESGKGMPLHMAFLAVPLVIFGDTRSIITPQRNKTLHRWIQANPEIRVRFALKAREVSPFIRLALAFSINYGSVEVDQHGKIALLPRIEPRGKKKPRILSSDFVKKSQHIGKLFGQVDNVHNIFVMLGVRP